MELLVIPATAADALAWARGDISDDDVKPAAKPEAVFFRSLPSPVAYRDGLRAVHRYFTQGAVCFVGRTKIPSVARWLKKRGAIPTLKETCDGVEHFRYIITPEDFRKWMNRVRV